MRRPSSRPATAITGPSTAKTRAKAEPVTCQITPATTSGATLAITGNAAAGGSTGRGGRLSGSADRITRPRKQNQPSRGRGPCDPWRKALQATVSRSARKRLSCAPARPPPDGALPARGLRAAGDTGSAEHEELVGDVDARAAQHKVAAPRLAANRSLVRAADDGAVARKPVIHPELAVVLPEFEVALGDRHAGIHDLDEVVEVLGRLRQRPAADQAGAGHPDVLPRARSGRGCR